MLVSKVFLLQMKHILEDVIEFTNKEIEHEGYIRSKLEEGGIESFKNPLLLLLLIHKDRGGEPEHFIDFILMDDYEKAWKEEKDRIFEEIFKDKSYELNWWMTEAMRSKEEIDKRDEEKEKNDKKKDHKDEVAHFERGADILVPSGKIFGFLLLIFGFKNRGFVSSLVTQLTSFADKAAKFVLPGDLDGNFIFKCVVFVIFLIWYIAEENRSESLQRAIVTVLIEFVCELVVFLMKKKKNTVQKLTHPITKNLCCCFFSDDLNQNKGAPQNSHCSCNCYGCFNCFSCCSCCSPNDPSQIQNQNQDQCPPQNQNPPQNSPQNQKQDENPSRNPPQNPSQNQNQNSNNNQIVNQVSQELRTIKPRPTRMNNEEKEVELKVVSDL